MKRFYTDVTVRAADRAILLDGRPVRTPARATLALPTDALAAAIADEWRGQGKEIDPRSMPLTGLANAAIDQVTPSRPIFAADLARYAESDALAYRAEAPAALIAAEAAAWDPLLDWARARYDIHIVLAAGIVHVPQPAETIRRLTDAVAACDAFHLTALSPLVTISGSLIAALAVLERTIVPDAAFGASHLDEIWQPQQWGEDAEATAAREARRRDFASAARFLELLD